ncbi:MAG: hypothetical protein ACOCZ5_02310 [bacterium]
MYCHICKKEINYSPGVFPQLHLVKFHNITSKEYYDKYLRKEDEGYCLNCGKETTFLGIGPTKRYRQFCSSRCSNTSDYKKQSTKKTNKERYGNENYVNVEKMKETNLKKYGVECTIHSNKVKKSITTLRIKQRYYKIKKWINETKQNIEIIDVVSPRESVLKCNDCNNIFTIKNETLYLRYLKNMDFCVICNPYGSYSGLEKQLLDFIKENTDKEIIENDRTILEGKELDIYIPELKLAFEFNGLHWHSECYNSSDYHIDKTNKCEEKGIHLIHIYEDDWNFKENIVKSRILNLLGKSDKVYARKCLIKEVPFKEAKEFLEENHLQGSCVSKIRLGLYHNNELVSLMTFGKLRKNLGYESKEGSYELLRFCNKINNNVIGGANKLFKYFINTIKPNEVISYADRSWTMNNGNSLYEKLNFKFINTTKPNYFYINKDRRENRFNYRKQVLIKEGFDKNKTEHEIMLEREIYRIYDSGQLKYKYL